MYKTVCIAVEHIYVHCWLTTVLHLYAYSETIVYLINGAFEHTVYCTCILIYCTYKFWHSHWLIQSTWAVYINLGIRLPCFVTTKQAGYTKVANLLCIPGQFHKTIVLPHCHQSCFPCRNMDMVCNRNHVTRWQCCFKDIYRTAPRTANIFIRQSTSLKRD